MKHTLAIFAIVCLSLLPPLPASDVYLQWDPPPWGPVRDYKLYAHTNHIDFTNLNDAIVSMDVVTNVTVIVTDLSAGGWFFVVTAFNMVGMESLPSNTCKVTIHTIPTRPRNLRVVEL